MMRRFYAKSRLWTVACLVTAASAAACNRTHEPQGAFSATTSALVAPGISPPSLSRSEIIAGEDIALDCSAAASTPDGPAARPTRPYLAPDVPVVRSEGAHTVFRPTQAGTYVTRCVPERGDGYSRPGPVLTVLPAAPRAVRLRVDTPRVPAGDRVALRCEGIDAFGNTVRPTANEEGAPAPVQYLVEGDLVATRPDGAIDAQPFWAGPLAVHCRVSTWPHLGVSQSETLTVDPAPLVAIEAVVLQPDARAHEPVPVRCLGVDALQQRRPLPEALLQSLDEAAVVQGHALTADIAGTYRALCVLPEQHEPGQAPTPALTSAPVSITVQAARPQRLEVRLHRIGACLIENSRLPITWRIFDAYNNEVHTADVSLTTEPPTQVTRDRSGGFLIAAAGAYTLTLKATGPGTESLAPWREEVMVNSTPPKLVITTPRRAAMMQQASTEVMLEGYIEQGLSPLTRAVVNGVALTDAIGQHGTTFRIPYQGQWGLNMVTAEVEDACGNADTIVQSFLLSESYYPFDPSTHDAAPVPSGLRAVFGQRAWDDGDQSTDHDVAGLMQQALESQSLENLIPRNLGAFPQDDGQGRLPEGRKLPFKPFMGKISGVEVYREGTLAYAHPKLEYIYAIEGGWDVKFVLDDLYVPFELDQWVHLGALGSRLTKAHAALQSRQLRIEARILVSMRDGLPYATVDPERLVVSFAEGRVPFVAQALTHDHDQPGSTGSSTHRQGHLERMTESATLWLLNHVPSQLQKLIEERVQVQMSLQMDDFLRNLKVSHSVQLQEPLRDYLKVASGLDAIHLTGERGTGSGEFGFFAQFKSTGVPPPARPVMPDIEDVPALGPICREKRPRLPLNLVGEQSFAVAVHDDLINQMSWKLWREGTLSRWLTNLPSRQQAGPITQRANLLDAANNEFYLLSPPVIMPADRDDEIIVGVGDVWVRAQLDTPRWLGVSSTQGKPQPFLKVGFFLSATMRAKMQLDPDSGLLVVTPQGNANIQIQIVELERPAMMAAVRGRVMSEANRHIPQLMAHYLRDLTIPQFPIGKLPGVRDNARWMQDKGTLSRPAHGAEMSVQGSLRNVDAPATTSDVSG